MNSLPFLRNAITILTIITAGVHAYLAYAMGLPGGIMFWLNSAGFLALMAALLYVKLPFLAGRERWVHYAYLAFTGVTILGWLAIGDKSLPAGGLGYATKLDEILLMIALWRHLKLAGKN